MFNMFRFIRQIAADDGAVKALFDHVRNLGIASVVFGAAVWQFQHPGDGSAYYFIQYGDRFAARSLCDLSLLRKSAPWNDQAARCRLSRLGISNCAAHLLACDGHTHRVSRLENGMSNIFNSSIDTDPQQQEAASPRVLMVRSFLR